MMDQVEHKVLDLRAIADDPREALRRGDRQPVLLDLPLHRVRSPSSLAFPCVSGAGHPLIETACDYLQGRCSGYEDSPLQRFSRAWMPSNAAEATGLSPFEPSHKLTAVQPYFEVLPWSLFSLETTIRMRKKYIEAENRAHGAELGIEEGTLLTGHTKKKGRLEFTRLTRLALSIRNQGYCRADGSDGDICGVVMLRGTEWAVSVSQGHHRVAAAAAVGMSHAPIRLGMVSEQWPSLVRREEVAAWPNVREGLFTPDQALDIFDRVFEGRQPVGCPSNGALAHSALSRNDDIAAAQRRR